MKFNFYLIILFSIILLGQNLNALEYSKVDFEGCPENAFCKKETGINRKLWIEHLRSFTSGKISEKKLNALVQSEYGLPVSGWSREEASLRPNIIMWDSPCKQHRSPVNKFYITEVFRKSFNSDELKNLSTLFFSRAILIDQNNIPYSIIVPRGDAPLFVQNGSLYYLKEEEGLFYGLFIDRDGHFKITKNETSSQPSKESICSKDQISLFNREAPGPNFYQGTYCKDIWDKSTKSYKTMVLGWSCN